MQKLKNNKIELLVKLALKSLITRSFYMENAKILNAKTINKY